MKNRGSVKEKAPDIESAMSELVFDRIDAVLAEILKEISLADLQNMRTITDLTGICSLFKNSFKGMTSLKKIAIFQTDLWSAEFKVTAKLS